MTENSNINEGRKIKAPSHIVWFAPDRENAAWVRIGAMWPTNKGNGFRQALDAVPLTGGNIVALPNEVKPKEADQGSA